MRWRSALPWWLLRNGVRADSPPLTRNLRCEIVIVGGGITGALLGRDSLGREKDVSVINARTIGEDSMAASTALIQCEVDAPLHALAHSIDLDVAVRV